MQPRLLKWLAALAAGLLGALTGSMVAAQAFPSRTTRIVVPYSPGGGTDLLTRPLAQKFTEAFGQQAVVDNRPGANGIIGTDLVAKSPPDGHTLVMSTNALTINPWIYPKMPFDTVRDLTPITIVASTQNLLAVHPSVPVRSVKELIALARSRPGELAFGSGGTGQPSHMSGELFMQLAGVKMIHVPYKGSGASITDLLAGQISVSFSSLPSLIQFVRAGKLRALATCGAKRSQALPNLPTVSETLPGYDVSLWFALLGPANMTRELATRLQTEVVRAISAPDMKSRLADQGYEPGGETPEQFSARIRGELDVWAKVVKAGNIRPQ